MTECWCLKHSNTLKGMEIQPDSFDLVVVGTGLQESLIAAYVSSQLMPSIAAWSGVFIHFRACRPLNNSGKNVIRTSRRSAANHLTEVLRVTRQFAEENTCARFAGQPHCLGRRCCTWILNRNTVRCGQASLSTASWNGPANMQHWLHVKQSFLVQRQTSFLNFFSDAPLKMYQHCWP